MMCSIFVLALLYLLSSAIPLLPRQPNQTSPFILQAFRPGSPIHLSSLNAHDGHFWLGKTTSSSCPSESKFQCRTGAATALVISTNGYATLDSNIPTGQTIYVAKDGALSFTEPHERNLTDIAYPSGFSYNDDSNSADASGGRSFTFSGTPSKGWLACPVAEDDEGPWQVFAYIRRTDAKGCENFEARGETYEGDKVWEYD